MIYELCSNAKVNPFDVLNAHIDNIIDADPTKSFSSLKPHFYIFDLTLSNLDTRSYSSYYDYP